MACSSNRETELIAQGWTRRMLLNEPRLSEVVGEYRNLGFEVLQEPVGPAECQDSDDCASCLDNPDLAVEFKVVYTRRVQGIGRQ